MIAENRYDFRTTLNYSPEKTEMRINPNAEGIGYFKEHHGKNYPPFESSELDSNVKEATLEYMKNADVIAAAPGIMHDVFSQQRIPGEMLAFSDGEYYWGSEAIYYFEKYNLKLPDSFLRYVLEHKIKIRERNVCVATEQEEWATASLKEAPYWRDGMTVEEYEREREYFHRNLEAILNGEYRPLWMQE